MVDLDQEIVELCMKYLPAHHQGAFKDIRLKVIYEDAYTFLEQSEEKFDIAVIDVPDPLENGPAINLFTREFYSLLSKHMNKDGLVVAQSGPTGPAFMEQCFSAVSNTMASVFPLVNVYETFIPSFGTAWGFVIGSNSLDPSKLSTHEIDARIRSRIENKLDFYDGVTHTGMFNIPKYLRESINKETRVITKSNPLFVP
jgi:spermidine synthase